MSICPNPSCGFNRETQTKLQPEQEQPVTQENNTHQMALEKVLRISKEGLGDFKNGWVGLSGYQRDTILEAVKRLEAMAENKGDSLHDGFKEMTSGGWYYEIYAKHGLRLFGATRVSGGWVACEWNLDGLCVNMPGRNYDLVKMPVVEKHQYVIDGNFKQPAVALITYTDGVPTAIELVKA